MRPRTAAALALLLLAGCAGRATPEIVAGVDACAECGMVVDRPNQACGFIDGAEFVTFDSPLCLLRNYEARRNGHRPLPVELYFADALDGSLHPAREVTFLLTEHAPTVMQSGALCFARRADAEAALTHDDERLTDWDGFRFARGTPDRVLEVRFEPAGLVPASVEASKGELVLWKARGHDLGHDVVVAIKGYPEIGEVRIPASGEEVTFRMEAARPGAGFPVVDALTGQALGALRVRGAHTADEEAL